MLEQLCIVPGTMADLPRHDPRATVGIAGEAEGRARLRIVELELAELQRRLSAEATRSAMLILEGIDAAGRDATIRSLLRALDPQGVRVVSFQGGDGGGRRHDFLWRIHGSCPARGEMAIFARSHYEDVGWERALRRVDADTCERRYRHIREFERLLVDEGTAVVKAHLHISKEEQRARLQTRVDTPTRRWRVEPSDLELHRRWEECEQVHDEVLTATSTTWAPWYVVPAEHPWVRDLAVAELLVGAIRRIAPEPVSPDPGLIGLAVG